MYQDLLETTEKIKKEFAQNPNRSLSALFREIRAESRSSLFGDFVLMVEVVRCSKNPTRRQVYWMVKDGEEYKTLTRGEKVKYYDALIYTALGAFKLP